jgi:hypothetical protein
MRSIANKRRAGGRGVSGLSGMSGGRNADVAIFRNRPAALVVAIDLAATAAAFLALGRTRGRLGLALAVAGLVADIAAPAGFRYATVALGLEALATGQRADTRLLLLDRVERVERGDFDVEFGLLALIEFLQRVHRFLGPIAVERAGVAADPLEMESAAPGDGDNERRAAIVRRVNRSQIGRLGQWMVAASQLVKTTEPSAMIMGPRASPSAIGGCPSTSAMPRLRSKSCGDATCREWATRAPAAVFSTTKIGGRFNQVPLWTGIAEISGACEGGNRAIGRLCTRFSASFCSAGPQNRTPKLALDLVLSLDVEDHMRRIILFFALISVTAIAATLSAPAAATDAKQAISLCDKRGDDCKMSVDNNGNVNICVNNSGKKGGACTDTVLCPLHGQCTVARQTGGSKGKIRSVTGVFKAPTSGAPPRIKRPVKVSGIKSMSKSKMHGKANQKSKMLHTDLQHSSGGRHK